MDVRPAIRVIPVPKQLGLAAIRIRGAVAWLQGAAADEDLTEARALLDVLCLRDGGQSATTPLRSDRAQALLPKLQQRLEAAQTTADADTADLLREVAPLIKLLVIQGQA